MALNDLRRAVRRLRSQRGTLLLALGMLTLAIGATTAMFTVLDALILHPVPFRDAEHLTAVMVAKEGRFLPTAPADVLPALRDSGAFERVEGVMQRPVVLEGGDGLVTYAGARITSGLLDLLGVVPVAGRGFTADEGRPGTDDRILIAEELWTSLYGRDPAIVGRRIQVSGASTEVVGVLPAGFRFPFSTTMAWRPLDFSVPPAPERGARPMVYARLKRNLPDADALRLADAALRGVADVAPDEHVRLRPIAAGMLDSYSRGAVTAMSAAVVLVFVVLCANAMNLMLTRLGARQREFGVCSALGASRLRLLREALAETALVGCGAAAGGLALAAALVRLAIGYLPAALVTRTLTPVALNGRALAATSMLALIAAAVAGVLPAWLATRVDAADALRGTGRGATDVRGHRRMAGVLLIAEVALAAALLAGAAQLVRSFVNLTRIDRGLNSDGVITAWIALPRFAFGEKAGRVAFEAALEERLRQLPGVEQVSLSYGIPPSGGALYFGGLRSDLPGAPNVPGEVTAYNVTSQFFDLYGIKLIAGNTFSRDSAETDVVLGEKLARTLWPQTSAVGHTFTIQGHESPYRVIGVVRETFTPTLDPRLDTPEMYHPLTAGDLQVFAGMRCGSRCPGLDVIRRTIRGVSAQTLIERLGPMDEAYLEELARPRAAAALAAIFAVVALMASAGGLFGVLNAAVARRRREFGIRVALGIAPRRLTLLVLKQALALSSLGLLFGMAGAWALARALAALTYGVSPADPWSWAAVFGSLAITVLLAAWRPGVAASRVDPAQLLRAE